MISTQSISLPVRGVRTYILHEYQSSKQMFYLAYFSIRSPKLKRESTAGQLNAHVSLPRI